MDNQGPANQRSGEFLGDAAEASKSLITEGESLSQRLGGEYEADNQLANELAKRVVANVADAISKDPEVKKAYQDLQAELRRVAYDAYVKKAAGNVAPAPVSAE